MLEYKWKIGKKKKKPNCNCSIYICLPLYLLGLFHCMLKNTQLKLALVVNKDFIES